MNGLDLNVLRGLNAVFGLIGILMIFALLVGPLVFWVVMLMDCFKREWPEKNMWLIVLIMSLFFGLHLFSAALYFLLVKRKGPSVPANRNGKTPPPATPTFNG